MVGAGSGSLPGRKAFGDLKPKGMALEPALGLGFAQAEDYFAGCRASLTCSVPWMTAERSNLRSGSDLVLLTVKWWEGLCTVSEALGVILSRTCLCRGEGALVPLTAYLLRAPERFRLCKLLPD